jgi:hypothetical protein
MYSKVFGILYIIVFIILLHSVVIRPAPKLKAFKQMNRDFPCINTEVCKVLNG